MQKYISLILVLFGLSIYAQQTVLSGVVVDENNIPLPGATVQMQGSQDGVITDFNGNFSIDVNSDTTIEVSYTGYEKYVLNGPFDSVVQIQLVPSNALEEVVITALGIRRAEKALGYAVQGIKAGEISKVKATNVVNSLAGKVAGVNITGSAAGPSASSNINIRGASSLMGNKMSPCPEGSTHRH